MPLDSSTQPTTGVQISRERCALMVMGAAGHPGKGPMVGWKKFRTAATAYVQLTPEHGGKYLTGGTTGSAGSNGSAGGAGVVVGSGTGPAVGVGAGVGV